MSDLPKNNPKTNEASAENKPANDKKAEALRVVKYALFAASAGIIELGSNTLLNLLPYFKDVNHQWLSYLIALVLSVIWNFTFNRKFTFKSANNIPIAMAKVAAYYAVFAPLSSWFEHYLVGVGVVAVLATVINMLINFITEFLYQRFFVFGKSLDTNGK